MKLHNISFNNLGRRKGKMIFRRQAAERAYSLECEAGCGKRLLLPETQLLSSFTSGG